MISPNVFFDRILPGEQSSVSIYEPRFNDPHRIVLDEPSDELLTYGDFPELAAVLFKDSTVLEDTLREVGVTGGCDRLETVTQHQSGQNGIIRIFRAVSNENLVSFVVHVSRFPAEDSRSDYLKREFDDLRYLSRLFEVYLSSEVLDRYNVVRPIAFAVSGEFRGRRYPFTTMPYVSKGELHQHFVYGINTHGQLVCKPVFQYAKQYTTKMESMTREMRYRAIYSVEDYTYMRLARDLLIFNGIIYHATGGIMLKDIRINAGDFMVDINPDEGMDLTLVSIHDGFTEPVTPYDWVRRMKGHKETCANAYDDIPTFPSFEDKFFYECLDIAGRIVNLTHHLNYPE